MIYIPNEIQKLIIQELMQANRRIDSFTLFKRLKINFSDFSKQISVLEKNELISIEELIITLTLKGLEVSVKQEFNDKRRRKKIELQNNFTCHKIPVDEFYIPTLHLLDKKTFPLA